MKNKKIFPFRLKLDLKEIVPAKKDLKVISGKDLLSLKNENRDFKRSEK